MMMFFIMPPGLMNHILGNKPILLVVALLGLGLSCGPIQLINAKLAMDVSYLCNKTAKESMQQVGGNLVSALHDPFGQVGLE